MVGCQGTASQVVIRGSKKDNTGATLSLCHVRVYGNGSFKLCLSNILSLIFLNVCHHLFTVV